MMNYTNIDINSSGASQGSGVITAMQIIMNNTPNVKSAVASAKSTYDNINEKLKSAE